MKTRISNRVLVTTRCRSSGFSLVELIVTVLISSIVLVGALSVFSGSRRSIEDIEQSSSLNELGHYSLEQIARDARSAGYGGCLRKTENWMPSAFDKAVRWSYSSPIEGLDGDRHAEWPRSIVEVLPRSATPPNDILIVHTPKPNVAPIRVGDALITEGPNLATDADVTPTHNLSKDNVVVVSDCRKQLILSAYDLNILDGVATAKQGVTAAVERDLHDGSTQTHYVFEKGAQIIPIVTSSYYVAPSKSGKDTALWRRLGTQNPEEIARGVDGLQLLYGEDTNDDQQVDRYSNANEVDDWAQIVSVRIALLLRSPNPYKGDIGATTYSLLNVTAGPFSDHKLRQVFTTTINLRNRTT